MSNETLVEALASAGRGWPVMPVYELRADGTCSCRAGARCKHPGKHPRIRRWPKAATCDPAVIKEWWERWPDSNLGVLTGARSGLVALDVDPRHGGDDTVAEFEAQHVALPRTIETVTGGGGRHLLFRHPQGSRRIPSRTNALGPGLDVKGDGGFIVAPPSRHASGATCVWEVSGHPEEVELADFPDSVNERLAAEHRASTQRSVHLPTRIKDGQRNDTLTRIAGLMRLVVAPPEGILGALREINIKRCRPRLPDDEVQEIAASAARWHALPWLTSPREFFADDRLTSTQRHVLRALCDYADSGGECFPSIKTIAGATGLRSEQTVSKALERLAELGRIQIDRSARFHRYRILRSFLAESETLPCRDLVLSPQSLRVSAHESAPADVGRAA
jgi:bifunctional DNA primase/polymerase-like protein/helix-turn-helix protein/primase-like protein